MSLWMLIKLVAGLVVLAMVIFTGLLVHHVKREPLGWIFSEIVPVTVESQPLVALPAPSGDLPQIDPGAKVFERARELIAIGDLSGARDKLRTVVSIYPRSGAAPEARRIVGEMNLDEVLSAGWMEGKEVYKVKRGDAYLGIAAKFKTSLDMIMHLNGLMDLRSLQPGDELVVMPLEFRLLIEPQRDALSVWDGGRFIKEYPLVAVEGAPRGDQKTTISGKSGFSGERRYSPGTAGFRDSTKVLTLERLPLSITALEPGAASSEDGLPRGFYLSPPDMEELSLMIRPGNEVEIRSSGR